MDDANDWIEVDDAMLLHETEGAAKYMIDNEVYWIPLSLVNSSLEKHETGTIEVLRWKAEELGLE